MVPGCRCAHVENSADLDIPVGVLEELTERYLDAIVAVWDATKLVAVRVTHGGLALFLNAEPEASAVATAERPCLLADAGRAGRAVRGSCSVGPCGRQGASGYCRLRPDPEGRRSGCPYRPRGRRRSRAAPP